MPEVRPKPRQLSLNPSFERQDPSLRRLTRELKQCSIEGVSLEVDESDLFNLVAYVEGPGTLFCLRVETVFDQADEASV